MCTAWVAVACARAARHGCAALLNLLYIVSCTGALSCKARVRSHLNSPFNVFSTGALKGVMHGCTEAARRGCASS
eukprot:1661922-Alexandrium_andersonii.AAC.1